MCSKATLSWIRKLSTVGSLCHLQLDHEATCRRHLEATADGIQIQLKVLRKPPKGDSQSLLQVCPPDAVRRTYAGIYSSPVVLDRMMGTTELNASVACASRMGGVSKTI